MTVDLSLISGSFALLVLIVCAGLVVRAGVLRQVAEESSKLASTRGEEIKDLNSKISAMANKLDSQDKRIDHLEQIIRDKDRKIDDLLAMLGRRVSDSLANES